MSQPRQQKIDRRTFLRGALAGIPIAVGVPILDEMLDGNGRAFAATGQKIPVRFGVFYWGLGVGAERTKTWVPARTGYDWEYSDALMPFGDLKPYVTTVTGTNHRYTGPGHIPARGIALSSSHDMDVTAEGVGLYRGEYHPEPTVDVIAAERWKGQCAFDSIELAVSRRGTNAGPISWRRGGRNANRHEPSPQRLFNRLFRGEFVAGDPDGILGVTAAQQRSMLDAVREDARRLERRLGISDRQRMEQHLESLRSIERRLQVREKLAASHTCRFPDPPPARDFGDGTAHEEKEAKNQVMSDLLAVALACNLTRVFSYEFSSTGSTAIYWEVGVNEEAHTVSHKEKDTGDEMPKITRFIMQNYATLARALRDQREGAGNVLDNTLILGTSEHANAGRHNFADHPLLFLGKAGGGIRAGLHHRDPNPPVPGVKPINDPRGNLNAPRVLLSALHAVGIPLTQLGQDHDDRLVKEPLSEILTGA
jgi:hypothetical protein